MKIKEFFQSKIFYFVCLLVYSFLTFWLLGSGLFGLIITLFIYFPSIALTFLGDSIIRYLTNARSLMIEEDERIKILFEEIYEEVKEQHSNLTNIEVCITKGQGLKVEAITPKTIIISKLALETFSDDELKGLLASQFGRVISHDSLIQTFVQFGNGFFSIALFMKELLIKEREEKKENNTIIYKKMGKGFVFLKVIYQLFKLVCSVILTTMCIIGSMPKIIGGKQRIYVADEFASKIGYTTELKNALLILDKLNLVQSPTNRVLLDYPERIAKLEALETNMY